ncbi:MAG: hypothetical protein AAB815_00585 [Patescibacteria group bacterium]
MILEQIVVVLVVWVGTLTLLLAEKKTKRQRIPLNNWRNMLALLVPPLATLRAITMSEYYTDAVLQMVLYGMLFHFAVVALQPMKRFIYPQH